MPKRRLAFSSINCPSASKAAPACGINSRAPNHGAAPRVRRTGSQAAWPHHRAEGARRSAQDRDRPPAEHPVDVRGRATEPVDGVLEHAGNAVVVLGCEQQQATVVIDGLDAQTSVAHGWRFDDIGSRLRGLVEMLRWISQFIGQPRSRAATDDAENYSAIVGWGV